MFVQVGRTRQDSQKDLLVHQDSRHLLLINAEDPSQGTYLRNLKKKTLIRLEILNNIALGFLIKILD